MAAPTEEVIAAARALFADAVRMTTPFGPTVLV